MLHWLTAPVKNNTAIVRVERFSACICFMPAFSHMLYWEIYSMPYRETRNSFSWHWQAYWLNEISEHTEKCRHKNHYELKKFDHSYIVFSTGAFNQCYMLLFNVTAPVLVALIFSIKCDVFGLRSDVWCFWWKSDVICFQEHILCF